MTSPSARRRPLRRGGRAHRRAVRRRPLPVGRHLRTGLGLLRPHVGRLRRPRCRHPPRRRRPGRGRLGRRQGGPAARRPALLRHRPRPRVDPPRRHLPRRRQDHPGARHRSDSGDRADRPTRPGQRVLGVLAGTSRRGSDCKAPSLETHGPAVHLHHARPASLLPARPRGAPGHQHLDVPGRQDRRARRQRVGQVVAAADHGRRGRRLHRRGPPHARASPSATWPRSRARRVAGRARQRRRRRGARSRPARPLQRGVRGHGRPRRRLRQAAGRAGRPAGPDRRRQRLGPRAHPRHRHGRAAPARRATPR